MRDFLLKDGNQIREQLPGLSDRDYTSTYCILDATLPMQRYVATAFGGTDVLDYRSVQAAAPAAGEVRIRQTAIGVNYIDVYVRRSLYRMTDPPAAIGMEAAGSVIDVDPGVAHLLPGGSVGAQGQDRRISVAPYRARARGADHSGPCGGGWGWPAVKPMGQASGEHPSPPDLSAKSGTLSRPVLLIP